MQSASGADSATVDPDLYVTNSYDGLVGVTRDNCTWKSIGLGPDRVYIHPEDINAPRGSFFVIGVYGAGSDDTPFELTVTTCECPEIKSIQLNSNFFVDVSSRYEFFALHIDPRAKERLELEWSFPVPTSDAAGHSHDARHEIYSDTSYRCGHGIYVDESRTAHALPQAASKQATVHLSQQSPFPCDFQHSLKVCMYALQCFPFIMCVSALNRQLCLRVLREG